VAEVFELVDAQVVQHGAGRQMIAYQFFGCQREQDLPTMAGGQNAGDAVQR
jgi:hypothetical protein